MKRPSPLNPGPSRLKRTRMKPQSKKTRLNVAAHHPQRVAWLQRFTHCMGCQKRFYSGAFTTPSVHEIIGGPQRCKTFEMPALWLALCFPCNQEMGSVPNRDKMIWQLHLKFIYDPECYDLASANTIWARNGAEPITHDEILSTESFHWEL